MSDLSDPSFPTEQHDAATRGSIHKILVGVVHLWFASAWLRVKRLPTKSMYWVYSQNMEWGMEILGDRRIKVTIEIEDIPR